jgi:hypothetical protein
MKLSVGSRELEGLGDANLLPAYCAKRMRASDFPKSFLLPIPYLSFLQVVNAASRNIPFELHIRPVMESSGQLRLG